MSEQTTNPNAGQWSGEPCAECGGLEGKIQPVDVSWPEGKQWSGWLHPECEAACTARLEADGWNKPQ